MEINAKVLEKLGVNLRNAERFGAEFATQPARYGIDTPLRQAHFLAQILHESGMCRYTEENLNYSAAALRSVFGKYFPTDALAETYERQPERIGARVYANRMGNGDETSGEGYHYRGRGLIQLTGKDNYGKFSAWANQDVLDDPDRVAEEFPVLSALYYWNRENLNQLADQDNLKALTKRINGGYNGLEHRQALLNKAKSLFDVIAKGAFVPDQETYAVTASRLNLRATPQVAADNIIDSLVKGTLVKKLTTSGTNGWVKIQIHSSTSEGYVAERYLQMI